MSRLVQAAVLLPCWVLILWCARDRIVEALQRRGGCEQSWCVCEIDCEAVR